jgi:hypothetical protein
MDRKLTVPTDEEIRRTGVEAVIRSLGIARAAMFFRKTVSQKLDYLELKEELFGDRTVSDLYREIKRSE